MPQKFVVYIKELGPRPAFGLVADHLWGPGCDIDSDGNSESPGDTQWTELTLILRGSPLRVDVDPVSEEPLVLAVRSSNEALCLRTADFISACSGGRLERSA